MRYTTVIDISEFPLIYRNLNVRLLYFHLCLKSGYHDDDRDILDISIRRLADDVGLTLSATRHALKMLSHMQLIRCQGSIIEVKKWISEKPISKRQKTKEDERQSNVIEQRKRQQIELEKESRDRELLKIQREETHKTSFMLYYEMQMKKAADGDADAIAAVKRHKSTYELHQKQMEIEANLDEK